MKERTCILIKPDGTCGRLAGKVIDRLESEGFTLLAAKLLPPSRSWVEPFYSVHHGKPFYAGLLEFMLSGPTLATVWEGERIIEHSRRVIGATNSPEAAAGTLRKLYGTDNRRNLVHGSDSPESAAREIAILFRNEEICRPAPPLKAEALRSA